MNEGSLSYRSTLGRRVAACFQTGCLKQLRLHVSATHPESVGSVATVAPTSG